MQAVLNSIVDTAIVKYQDVKDNPEAVNAALDELHDVHMVRVLVLSTYPED